MTLSTARKRSGRSASCGTRYGMRASWIFRFARTSRWAMVASGTRNARAISGVDRPPSSRSVSATRASGASAGWQQVKISRRRSSCTGPSSGGTSPAGCSSAAWACRSSRTASRRWRSTARLPAVVMIQPAGLGGRPVRGQRSTATAKASWTASSARSMSPRRRTRTATARAYSRRNTSEIAAGGRSATALVRLPRRRRTGAPRPAAAVPLRPACAPTRAPRPGRAP